MAEKKDTTEKPKPIPKLFFESMGLPGFRVNEDKFSIKGQTFIVKKIDAKGIYAVPWPEQER